MEGCYCVDEENANGNKNKIVSKEMGYKNYVFKSEYN